MTPDDINLEEAEQRYLRQAMRSGADIALVDDSILHINHGLASLTGTEREDDDRFVRLLLFTRGFNNLVWARKSLFTGYVVQALLLTRSAMEDWGSIKYVQHHHEAASLWLHPSTNWRGPNFERIWEDAPEEADDAARINTIALLKTVYRSLSLFAHPRAASSPYLISWDADQTFFHAGPAREWNAARFERGLYYLLYVVQGFFAAVDQVIIDYTGEAADAWRAHAVELTELITKRVVAIRAVLGEMEEPPEAP